MTAHLWQVVEVNPDRVVRHPTTYPTRDQADRAAADMANQLDDNDPTEYYAEPAEEAL